jgi:hypothetical protein
MQEKLPPGFQFRVLGDDGSQYWETVRGREEIAGMFDFELEPNSANSNRQVQQEVAQNTFATIMNPLLIQMGVVTPGNIYNAAKNMFQALGVKDFSKYITKPQGPMQIYTPEEIANATLAGVEVKLGPEQDLQGFIEYFQYIVDHDELLGQFNQEQVVKLARKVQEAQAMAEAVAAQQAQVANQQQVATNAALTTQAAPQATAAPTAPAGSEGA